MTIRPAFVTLDGLCPTRLADSRKAVMNQGNLGAPQHVVVVMVVVVVVAAVEIATTLLAVWWYVPPAAEIAARRAERDQLQTSIEDLTKRGARITLSTCGPKKRLCVLIDESEGFFGDRKLGEVYRIAKGY
jgi:hypothetical protein